MALQPNAGHGLLILEVSGSHRTTHPSRQDSSGRVISSSQRPLPDNTQHSQQTNIRTPGGIRSNPQSQQSSGRRPTPQTARPLRLALSLNSFSSLSYDRSKASSKASSPYSAIKSVFFQMRASSPFLKVIQQLPTSSSLSSCHFYPPLYLSFSNPFQKAVSTQNVTNPVRLPFTYFMQDIISI